MDSKHHQILFGIADEPCSISDFLALMRPAGGSECCHFPPPAELEVFWYPFGAGAGEFSFPAPPSLSVQDQERVARFLHSLENSELSEYVGMINLVQFWAPITTGGGEIILSVSDQPFGVGRLSNGTCRYRFDCVRNLGGGGGDLIKSAFVTGLPQCSQLPLRGDEPQHRYGALSFWALPLVEPQTGSCDGVLEFVSTTAATFEIHRLFTQSFLNYGSKYYERFCENMAGTSFGNSGDLLLTSQQNISGTDNFLCEILSNGPLEDDEEHIDQKLNFVEQYMSTIESDHPTNWGVSTADEQIQVPTQVADDQIEENSGILMVQQLSLEPGNHNKVTAISRKGKRPPVNCDELRGYFGRRQKDAADELGVHLSTIKRWCRSCGIEKWPSHKKRNRPQNKGINRPKPMIVKATYGSRIVKFKIDSTTGFECLCKKLGDRFELEVGSFRIEYEDENGDLIMIPCTEDLKGHLDFLHSSKKQTMDLIVSPAN